VGREPTGCSLGPARDRQTKASKHPQASTIVFDVSACHATNGELSNDERQPTRARRSPLKFAGGEEKVNRRSPQFKIRANELQSQALNIF
jgi:hypothetical protein